jgi:hypothetical protein
VSTVTKLAEIQEAILQLDPQEHQRLRQWLDDAAFDLEQDSDELETELLKGVQGPHAPYSSAEMRDICERIIQEKRGA